MNKLLSTSYSEASFNISSFVIRVTFAALLLVNHGIPKLMGFGRLSKTFFDPLHIGHRWSLLIVIFAEVFCALFVVLGLFTRLAAIPLVINMLVAVFWVHRGQPLTNSEMAILYLAAFLGILLTGPGRYSVDGALGR